MHDPRVVVHSSRYMGHDRTRGNKSSKSNGTCSGAICKTTLEGIGKGIMVQGAKEAVRELHEEELVANGELDMSNRMIQ